MEIPNDILFCLFFFILLVLSFTWLIILETFMTTREGPKIVRSDRERVYLDPVSGEEHEFHKLDEDSPGTVGMISVVVPAFNEEKRLSKMLDEALDYLENKQSSETFLSFEIIIVDDGSSDSTTTIGLEYSERYGCEKIKLLTLDHNRGKGGAIRLGVLSARGQYILMADADGATTFSDLSKLEGALQHLIDEERRRRRRGVKDEERGRSNGNVAEEEDGDEVRSNGNTTEENGDQVRFRLGDMKGAQPTDEAVVDKKLPCAIAVGSRAHLEKEAIAQRSIFRTFLMKGFHVCVYLLGNVKGIKDTQCGFKLFTRPAAYYTFMNLRVERWAFDVELLYIAQQLGIPITEVSVNWQEVEGSKLVPFWSWLQMARDLFKIRAHYLLLAWKLVHRPPRQPGDLAPPHSLLPDHLLAPSPHVKSS